MGEMINLSSISHLRDLSEGLWQLCREKYKADVALDFKKHGQGNIITLHHLILAVFAPKFKNFQKIKFMFNKDCGFSEEDMNLVIEFIYLGGIQVKEDRLPMLKTAAEAMSVESLLKTIEEHYQCRNASGSDENLVVEHEPQSDSPVTEHEDSEEEADDDDGTESDPTYREDEEESDDDSSAEEVAKKKPATAEKELATAEKKPATAEKKLATAEKKPATAKKKPATNAVNHKRVIEYRCSTCNKLYKNYLTLMTHLKSHKVKKTAAPKIAVPKVTAQSYKCSKCSFVSHNRFNLKSHMAAIHQMDLEGNVVPKTVKCPQCDYMCVFKFQLAKHNNSKHIRKHVCKECGYSCSRRANLKIHINGKHKNERAHMCELCGYRTSYKSGLKGHMLTHFTDRSNVCEICGQRFATPATLKAHITTHGKGPKPHSCHECKFTSWTRYSLKMHYHNVHKTVFNSSEEFVKWYKELQKKS